MPELHFPWLELSIVLPIFGGVWAMMTRRPETARWRSLVFCGLTFVCATGEWLDFSTLHTFAAHDHWDIIGWIAHGNLFVVDELSAPLLPLVALMFLMTILSTLRTKIDRFSFSSAMFSQSILMAMFSCQSPWVVIWLLTLSCLPPWLEMRHRQRSTRVFEIHMGLSTCLLVLGQFLVEVSKWGGAESPSVIAIALLGIGALVRSGVIPVHCWMTDLYENATLGTALLFSLPLTGVYAVLRLVLPDAPSWILQSIALGSLVTSIYAAGMALVQRDSRRFFCYLLLSHASLVLVGVELATAIGLTGGLCVWLSVVLSLGGFGLTLRCVESRIGRVSLTEYHGLFERMPSLAALFLLTGLSSIGFPGTVGFVGMELLVEGAVDVYAGVGSALVLAAALNGIAVMHAYFRIFTGTNRGPGIPMFARTTERIAVIVLATLILLGGLIPQPGVTSRYHAAASLIRHREEAHGTDRTDGIEIGSVHGTVD